MQDQRLSSTFHALSDPTRRAIVAGLSSGEAASLSEIAAPFDMSLPGVMKHVGVLAEAGLIEREKVGRVVLCRLKPEPMAEAINWLEEIESFWTKRLDALANHIEGGGAPKVTARAAKAKPKRRN